MVASPRSTASRFAFGLAALALLGSAVLFSVWRTRSNPGAPCGYAPGGPGALSGLDSTTGELLWSRTVGDVTGFSKAGDAAVIRTAQYRVRAYDLATGRVRWCKQLATSGYEDRDDGLVAVGELVAVFDGADVIGIDASTGTEAWRVPAPPGELSLLGGTSIWLVDEGTGMALAAPPPGVTPSPDDVAPQAEAGFALNPADGSRNPNPGPEPRSAGLPAPESIDGLSLRVPYPSGKPRNAFTATVTDMADKLIWTAQLPGSSGHIVPGSGGPVVITTAGGSGTALTARGFDATTGQALWAADLGRGNIYTWPGDSNSLYLTYGTSVRAIDSATGTKQWEADYGSLGLGGRYSQPGSVLVIATGDVIVGLTEAHEPHSD